MPFQKKDILQINNGLDKSADWDDHMSAYGFKKGVLPSPQQSIHNGIKEFATKGFHGQSPLLNGFEFTGWESAVSAHNGKGAAGYAEKVKTMMDSAQAPTPANYNMPAPVTPKATPALPSNSKKKK